MIWVVAALAIGAGLQRGLEVWDRRRHPAPGTLVSAGDARLHAVVAGSGPGVVIDSGLGGSSIEWSRVVDDLAGDFTVVTYDRPGFAWSPGSRCDRRAVAAAERLLALIEQLELSSAILVGHSLGGVHVRVAAALRPDLVRGLVLVDPSHEGMLDLAGASKAATATAVTTRVASWLAVFGLGRLLGRAFARLALGERRQPASEADAGRAHLSQLLTLRTVHGLRALAAEYAALDDSLRQLRSVAPQVEVPLVVITAGAPSADDRMALAREQIGALHVALVDGSQGGRQVLAERSGHLVPLDEPEIIVQCVRELAATLR